MWGFNFQILKCSLGSLRKGCFLLMMAEQLAQTSKGMTSNYMVACATEWQDLYGFWENRKVLEFYFDMF